MRYSRQPCQAARGAKPFCIAFRGSRRDALRSGLSTGGRAIRRRYVPRYERRRGDLPSIASRKPWRLLDHYRQLSWKHAEGQPPAASGSAARGPSLYGATAWGGPANAGVVYKIDPTGHETQLHTFAGRLEGAYPNSVVLDAAGNLYGTASDGGAAGFGVLYRLDAAGSETVLHNFRGGPDGRNPETGVVLDAAGNLFGTTSSGGHKGRDCRAGCGVVNKLDASGIETVLYTFMGYPDAANSLSGVTFDSAGNLYGTTAHGGASGLGAVYEVDAAGHERVPYRFTGAPDGAAYPYAGVIRDSEGNL